MGKVYMKVMVSFDTNEPELIKNPKKVVESALKQGVKVDGEVYFPMTEYNSKLYELYDVNDCGTELNLDDAFNECTITLTE